MADAEQTIKSTSGAELSALLDAPVEPTKKIAVLCHGLASHKGSTFNTGLARHLVAGGIATLRFDFFGHGQSTGRFQDLTPAKAVQDVESVAAWCKKQGYEEIALVGSSFGGNACLMAAATVKPKALVLRAPVSDYAALYEARYSDAQVAEWKKAGKLFYGSFEGRTYELGYCFYDDAAKQKAYAAASKVTAPVLLLHGTADDVVPLGQSAELSQHLASCVFVPLQGADHRLDGPNESFRKSQRLAARFLAKNF